MPIFHPRHIKLAIPLLCALLAGVPASLHAFPKSPKTTETPAETEILTPAKIWELAKPDAVKLAPGASAKPKAAKSTKAKATKDSRLKDAAADVTALKPKRFTFLYFSAHWCPPCRQFTPELVKFYNENKKNDDFELLFISADENVTAMADYMAGDKMPWFGVKPESKSAKALSKHYSVRGIPTLILLGQDGKIFTRNRGNAFEVYQNLRKTPDASAKPAAAPKPAAAAPATKKPAAAK